MIDQFSALGKTNFVGKDGFNWWIGQIAPPEPRRKVNAYQAQEQSYQHIESRFVLLDTIPSIVRESNFLMRIYRGQM